MARYLSSLESTGKKQCIKSLVRGISQSIIFVVLFTHNLSAQNRNVVEFSHKDWAVLSNVQNVVAFSEGEVLLGTTANNENPVIAFYTTDKQFSEWRLCLLNADYVHDASQNNANWIEVILVIDDDFSKAITSDGEMVENDILNLNLSSEKFNETIIQFQKGYEAKLFLLLEGNVIDKFAFSLNGFVASDLKSNEFAEQRREMGSQASSSATEYFDSLHYNNPFSDSTTAYNSFESYLESFIETANNVGIDLNYVYDHPIKIQFASTKGYNTDTSSVLALALGKDNDQEINIVVDPDYWSELDNLEKTKLMYHELSHDVLNARHVKDTSHLMHPYSTFTTIPNLVTALTLIFKQYAQAKDY